MTTERTHLLSIGRRFAAAVVLLFGVAAGQLGCSVDSSEGLANPGDGANDGTFSKDGTGVNGCPQKLVGCACATEGDHAVCGKVEDKIDGQTMCGKGVSVCTNGKWSDCILENAQSYLVPALPPGDSLQGLGLPVMCTNNPCDPYCINYPDTSTGVTDAGVNIIAVDGGLATVPDAGTLPCAPRTCLGMGATCGSLGNGCGGSLSCGTCSGGQTCGGGGVPFQCGTPTPPCVPKTTCGAGQNCGVISDGCGGTVSCGTCAANQICGSSVANQCASATLPCVPKTTCGGGLNCGVVSDGCGGTVSCGACTAPQTCGGGGAANVCGPITQMCTPKTCASLGDTCGFPADGCGGHLTCGTNGLCPAGQGCGVGGAPDHCAALAGSCTLRTCQSAGNLNCGNIGDGCGGILNCGTCVAGQVCGLGGTPNVCATSPNCTNFCTHVPNNCAAATTTSVKGKVYAPNGTDPLPNVIVYVPNASLAAPFGVTPFASTITCDTCTAPTGTPFLATSTADDGSFTLSGMPASFPVPIVIQVGRWRRVIELPALTPCVTTNIAAGAVRFARNQTEYGAGCTAGDHAACATIDNIPHIAISTGAVDGMECAIRKLGISDAEFTNPTGSGRVNFFGGSVQPGTYEGSCSGNSVGGPVFCSAALGGPGNPNGCYQDYTCGSGDWGGAGATPWETSLVGTPATLAKYDMVLFPCQGLEWNISPATTHATYTANLSNYLNAGGKVFATHYSYNWISNLAPFSSPISGAINWNLNQTPEEYQACTNNGQCGSGACSGGECLCVNAGQCAGGYACSYAGGPYYGVCYNTSYDPQLGYVNTSFARGQSMANWLQSIGASTTTGQIQVDTLRRDYSGVTAQAENWLTVNHPSAGIPVHATFNTPVGQASQCGRVVYSDLHVEDYENVNGGTQFSFPNECTVNPGVMTPQEKMLEFMLFDLASCVTPTGTPPPCVPATCSTIGKCGSGLADGCSGTIPGTCVCPANNTCNASNVCVPNNSCTPKTCAQLGVQCGPADDGCGGTINCSCTAPQTCGGSGIPGTCGSPMSCIAKTVAVACGTQNCGFASDGCGGMVTCGSCTVPQTCGGGGTQNICGAGATCNPMTMAVACTSQNCGPASNGCGGTVQCGTCVSPQTCGGGGVTGHCGTPLSCTPKTCAQLSLTCGPSADGCGGTLMCGTCTSPLTCGGAGMPGQCGDVVTYTDGYFVRDYDGSSCPMGTAPVWGLWSWSATTPTTSHIDFTVQTATTQAGLATATSYPILFSNPPGPVALAGQTCSAHPANMPAGSPDTEVGAASVDNTFMVNGLPRQNHFVRVTSHLAPSADILHTALLNSWDLQMDCQPSE